MVHLNNLAFYQHNMANQQKDRDIKPLFLHPFVGNMRIPLRVRLKDYSVTTDLWHSHQDFYELVLVLAGQAINDMEGESFPLRAGDLVLFTPDTSHRYRAMRNYQNYNVLFAPEVLDMLPGDFGKLPNFSAFFGCKTSHSPILHIDAKELPEAIDILESIQSEFLNHRIGWEEAGFADFCRFLIYVLRYAMPGNRAVSGALQRICQVLRLMENNQVRAFTLTELSNSAQMSESSFRHHFRRQFGIAPIDYLIRLRLRRAVLMMINSELPLTEIALQCGFSDSNYFTRRFRTAFGMPPREFRAMSRDGSLKFVEELRKLNLD